MSVDLDRIKDRIRKCLTLANDPGAMGGEITTAMAYARRMMLQHNLSEEEVRADAKTKDVHEIAAIVEQTEYAREAKQTEGTRLTLWETQLSNAVVRLIGTVQFYRDGEETKKSRAGTIVFNPVTGRPQKAQRLMFYGPKEDVADALTMIEEWTLTIMSLARLKFGGCIRGEGRAYAEGFTVALMNAVYRLQKEELAKAEQLEEGGRLDIRKLASGTVEQKAIILAERPSALALTNALSVVEAKKTQGSAWLEKRCGVELTQSHKGAGGGEYFGGAQAAGMADGARAGAGFRHSRKPKLGSGS